MSAIRDLMTELSTAAAAVPRYAHWVAARLDDGDEWGRHFKHLDAAACGPMLERLAALSHNSIAMSFDNPDLRHPAWEQGLRNAYVALGRTGLVIGHLATGETCPRDAAGFLSPENLRWASQLIGQRNREVFGALFKTYSTILGAEPASSAHLEALRRGLEALGKTGDLEIMANRLALRCVLTPFLICRKLHKES